MAKQVFIQVKDNVKLTQPQVDTLLTKHGEDAYQVMIEKLSDYKDYSGRVYKSDYMAIKKWVEDWWACQKKTEENKSMVLEVLEKFTEYLMQINDPAILNRGMLKVLDDQIEHYPSQRRYPLTLEGVRRAIGVFGVSKERYGLFF